MPVPRRRWVWGSVAVAIAAPLAWGILDRGLAAAYQQSRAGLEQRYSKALGRPLRLGDYQGLRLNGIRLGPSRILASGRDNSHLAASSVQLSVDPLASLLQHRWVITFHLEDLVANWHRNADGRFWVMDEGEGSLPVELRLHTRQPARFRVWTRTGDSLSRPPDMAVTFNGMVAFGNAQHGLLIKGRLDMPGGGWLMMKSHGVPFGASGQTGLTARKIPLDRLQPLLTGSPWHGLSGRLDGSLVLERSLHTGRCRGAMVLRDGRITLAVAGVERDLQFSPLHLRCNGQGLQLPASGFRSTDLAGTVSGVLNQQQELDFGLTLAAQLPPWADVAGGQLQSTLRLLGPLSALESDIQLEVTGWQRAATADSDAEGLDLPPLRLRAESRWHTTPEADPQLRGSLDAEAGSSRVAINGRLAPGLQVRSTTVRLHPDEWLWPAEAGLLASHPYDGLLAVERSTANADLQADFRLHHPLVDEDLSLRLTNGIVQLDGVLAVGTGRQLQLEGRMEGGEWQLRSALSDLDVSALLPSGLLDHDEAASPSALRLQLEAVASGHFGRQGRTPGQPDASFFRLEAATLDARLTDNAATTARGSLGPAHLQLQATDRQVTVKLESALLRSDGTLQGWPERPFQEAVLDLAVTVHPFSLDHLERIGQPFLGGELGFVGHLGGTIAVPRLNGDVSLANPQVGMVASQAHWLGRIEGQPGGHRLSLSTTDSHLEASFADHRAAPEWIKLHSGDGSFELVRLNDGYDWTAAKVPLESLQLVAHNNGNRQWLRGRLDGSGRLLPGNRFLEAALAVHDPQLGFLQGRTLALELQQDAQQQHVRGRFDVDPHSHLSLNLRQRSDHSWHVQVALQRMGLRLLRQIRHHGWHFARQMPNGHGDSSDLSGIVSLGTSTGSLDDQLATLQSALDRLEALDRGDRGEASPWEGLNSLEGMVDGELDLSGSGSQARKVRLAVDAHLWRSDWNVDHGLTDAPLQIRFEGPLHGPGPGSFHFARLPLTLLSLLSVPGVPVRGAVAGQGHYRDLFGQRAVTLDLELHDAYVHGRRLTMERGVVQLQEATLDLDVALKDAEVGAPLELRGKVHLDKSEESLDLRLTSRDEAMLLLTAFSDGRVVWDQGAAQFRLWLRGQPDQPRVNGYLALQDGQGSIADVPVRDLNANVIFDERNLFVKRLEAFVGEDGGRATAEGYIGLFDPISTTLPLELTLEAITINSDLAQARIDGELTLGDSIQALDVGGWLQLSEGVITTATGNNGSEATVAASQATPSEAAAALASWDFQAPLDLAHPRGRSPLDRSIREGIPRLTGVSLNRLWLDLGPDLELTHSRLARFILAGRLTLAGPIGPDLQPIGVVKLRNGRVGLFTSRFDLHPESRNVAIFTPSGGLVPYLDVAMSTREVNTARARSQALGEVAADDLLDNTTAFDRLNLVKILVLVRGRADQFPDNIELQSVPPLPEQELIGLIGGNAIGQLTRGNTSATVFSALGQPLIDPLLDTVTNRLGDRFTFAVYPVTFYSPRSQTSDKDSQRLTSEFVLATEVGLAITDQLNVAVIGAPNRRDLAPELNLNLQLGPSLAVQTNVDTGGHWKSSLQVVARF